MTWLIRGRALAPALVLFLALARPASAAAPAPLRIKNGHSLMVALGKTREAAKGIRPEKNVWAVELDAAFAGAVADLRDVTPNLPSALWSVRVEADHLVLDATRFLPGHVYRLELRRERQLLGSALVYLYPPAAPRVSRVSLDDQPEPADKGFAPATLPKGGL
jgi:hypothetical protein